MLMDFGGRTKEIKRRKIDNEKSHVICMQANCMVRKSGVISLHSKFSHAERTRLVYDV